MRMKKLAFYLYLFLLLSFVVLKFDGSFFNIKTTIEMIKINRASGIWNYNLVPLRSIMPMIRSIQNHMSTWAIISLSANIIAFIPWGFMLPLIYQSLHKFAKFIATTLLFILTIELFQFVTMTGFFDIDDIILNSIGCAIGYFFYCLIFIFIFRKRSSP
jgi:glycopeptide antibiotics resistance protein